MSTKWKYATIPAEERLKMLKSGNEALYKEEIARTKDAISTRLANGVDVSEQMKWADTVSYNYNLGKAQAMGIDPSNVAKEGYAGRLFGDMTESVGKNTSTVTEPKEVTQKKPYYKEPSGRSSESLHQSIVDSYVRAINDRGYFLQNQANEYIKSVNEDYLKQIEEVKKAYEKKNKHLDEALLNEGVSQGGGRVLSEELRAEDEYRDLLKNLQAERDKLIANIRNSLKEDLNSLSADMMAKASDEYYRYNALLAEEKNAEYEKERDAKADEKWLAEFNHQKEQDKLSYDEKVKNAEYQRSVTERELQMQQEKMDSDYEKWLKEFEEDKKNNDRDYALDREKFEYSKDTSESKDKDEAGTTPSNRVKYGEEYEYCLEYARKAKYSVVKDESGDDYLPKYTNKQLFALVYAFDLTDEEKKSICYEIGLYK